MKNVITLAREAGFTEKLAMAFGADIERFAALVREEKESEFKQRLDNIMPILQQEWYCKGVESEQEKQQRKAALDKLSAIGQELNLDDEPVAWMHVHNGEVVEFNDFKSCDECVPIYTIPPTAAIAARQMRDAAVKVCKKYRDEYRDSEVNAPIGVGIHVLEMEIQRLPVPEVQWRYLTDDEIDMLIDVEEYIRTVANQISVSNKLKAVIAKFKEKQL